MFEKATSFHNFVQKHPPVKVSGYGPALLNTALVPPSTVNDESLAWLKFGEFCEFSYFAKFKSSKA